MCNACLRYSRCFPRTGCPLSADTAAETQADKLPEKKCLYDRAAAMRLPQLSTSSLLPE